MTEVRWLEPVAGLPDTAPLCARYTRMSVAFATRDVAVAFLTSILIRHGVDATGVTERTVLPDKGSMSGCTCDACRANQAVTILEVQRR